MSSESNFLVLKSLQGGSDAYNNEVAQREKARLKEMQKLKKQKIQEILDKQNAAIDADMVCLSSMVLLLLVMPLVLCMVHTLTLQFMILMGRTTKAKGAWNIFSSKQRYLHILLRAISLHHRKGRREGSGIDLCMVWLCNSDLRKKLRMKAEVWTNYMELTWVPSPIILSACLCSEI